MALGVEDVKRALNFNQPLLKIYETEKAILAAGTFVVSETADAFGPVRKFDIECYFSKKYPETEPLVVEVGGTIERTSDRHMYRNGVCCTCVWEEWLATSTDTSVQAFCDGPLFNFFLSQTIYEQTGEWPFNERSHGAEGVAEAISCLLELQLSTSQALSYIRVVAAKSIKGHIPCPCGSGENLRDCHMDQLIGLRKSINRNHAKALHLRLRKLLIAERGIT